MGVVQCFYTSRSDHNKHTLFGVQVDQGNAEALCCSGTRLGEYYGLSRHPAVHVRYMAAEHKRLGSFVCVNVV